MSRVDSRQKHTAPITLTRRIVALAHEIGAVAMTYHASRAMENFQKSRPHIFFLNSTNFSRHQLPDTHANALGRCHHFVSKLGRPILLSSFFEAFAKVEPQLTEQLIGEAHIRGIHDQIMVPVYGPFNVKGIMVFAFDRKLDWKTDRFLAGLEQESAAYHNAMVRHFHSTQEDKALSNRENEVLTWIARGKSNHAISKIIGISEGSVDTYVRRIFEKMGVRDRVTAAVTGVTRGLVQ